ncbi:MMPL family transporter [Clostridium sp. 19966]|uniref:MMPL family transporter n=1 Tax=Clostridium sp. 19966 TaxID=2768166 RepID=UPI0028DF6A25|nr:MMPL family transporter [Clostridium sp. 19966]MDT8717767.1 MMPL family transporter [Clostridium sp. 19966]
MARLLYKLGAWCYKRPKRIILFWMMIIAVAVGLTLNYGINFKGDMTIPGTESENAGNLLKDAFGQTKDYGSVRVIFKVQDGKTVEDDSVKTAINNTLEKIQKEDSEVKAVTSPYTSKTISKNNKIAYADITYKEESDKVTKESKDKVLEGLKIANAAGLETGVGGSVSFSQTEIGGNSELVSIITAFVILVFTLGSFLAAGLPIITALIGLMAGLMAIMAGTNVVDMSSFSLSLASMVGLAVGIDYALFIISRYRQNLSEGYDMKEAAAIAMGTAGSAVLFAGVTVIIALCGLSLVGVPFLGVMGKVAAFMVLIVVMVSLTAVPAVIRLAGRHIQPRKKNKNEVKEKNNLKVSNSNFWGRLVIKHPIIMIISVILLTVLLGYSAPDMELGLPDNGMLPKNSVERTGYDLLSEGFGAGVNGSLVIVEQVSGSGDNAMQNLQATANEIKSLPGIANLSPVIPSKDGKIAMLSLTPTTGPNDKETKDLVNAIREKSKDTEKNYKVKLMVTGRTAVNIDTASKLSDAIPTFAIVVLGLAFVLMVLVFRSILVPIKAVLGFLMTLVATIGFDVLTLQKGNFSDLLGIAKPGPILCFIPIIVIGILFGLAMDYEVFLVSRMREHFSRTGNAREAVTSGIKSSGVVVAAAGLIMTVVFASFASQVDVNIKSMGIPMAFGVLFDAFVVRMTFVPAVMTLFGKSAWYMPKWLDRLLPKFDIEGEALAKEENIA